MTKKKPIDLSLPLFSDEEMGVQPGYIKPGNRQPSYPIQRIGTYIRKSDGILCYYPVAFKPFEVYVQQARAIWGDRYDYSRSVYTNNKAPINIYCPKHDLEFCVSMAQNHVMKAHGTYKPTGCPICRAEELHHREYSTDWRKYLKLCARQNRVSLINNTGHSKLSEEEKARRAAERKAKAEEARKLREAKRKQEQEQRRQAREEKLRLQKAETERRHKEEQARRAAERQMAEQKRIADLQQKFRREARKAQGPGYHYRGIKNIRNKRSLVMVHCPNPEHKWHPMLVDLILQGCKCRECAGRHQPREQRHQEWMAKINDKYGPNRFDLSEVHYVNNDSHIWVTCKLHHYRYQTTPDTLLRGAGGCPFCTASEGEAIILGWLENHGIRYQHNEVQVPNNDPDLPLLYLVPDFWLPDYNMFVEFNGDQHYENIPYFFEGQRPRTFEVQQKRDIYLRKYCLDKKINLLEIKYDDIKKIPKILKKALKVKT